MKLQKTFLAASLAVAAVAANAQDARPVQVTENLVNLNQIYGGNGRDIVGQVDAPVHGIHATNSTVIDLDRDWLPNIGFTGTAAGNKILDLGTGAVANDTQQGAAVKYDVFKYTTTDGTVVYQFSEVKTGTKSGIFVKDATTGQLVAYTGSAAVDVNTLEKGGQIDGTAGMTVNTGWENRQVNGEHIIYGFQGGSQTQAGTVDGFLVGPDGVPTTERVTGTLGAASNATNEVRYVQQGILANTGRGPVIDPSKNIYGVSARDNNNVVMMTGNGIALADLSLKGKLQTDGSVANTVLVKSTASGTQKTREYNVDGKRVLEIYNDDTGRELAPTYYEITANGTDLVQYNGAAPVAGTHIKTGTAQLNAGNFEISKVQNTVTNKNVTYKESVSTVDQTQIKAGITTPNAETTDIDKTFDATAPNVKSEQSVSTGVIGTNEDKTNKYGVEISKTTANAEGKMTTAKSTVTANGFTTNGFVDAAEYRLNGKTFAIAVGEMVDESTGAVKAEAVKEANSYTDAKKVEAVKEANTYTDTKSDQTLAESKAYTNNMIEQSGVGRISNRLDNVERTAYRGVAIALAANQPMPNIKPGQFAVFGGVGHYEGESAVSFGAGTTLADGRTSISGAFGFAGSEVGGRVGVSYTFGQ